MTSITVAADADTRRNLDIEAPTVVAWLRLPLDESRRDGREVDAREVLRRWPVVPPGANVLVDVGHLVWLPLGIAELVAEHVSHARCVHVVGERPELLADIEPRLRSCLASVEPANGPRFDSLGVAW